MRIAGWKHPEKDSEKQTYNYWEKTRDLAGKVHQAIPKNFPRSIDWSKIHTCSQRPNELDHNYYNRIHVVFKGNSLLPSDTDITHVTFNSLSVGK